MRYIYTASPAIQVQAEWTGFRSGVWAKVAEPPNPQHEKFRELAAKAASLLVILYAFGGAS